MPGLFGRFGARVGADEPEQVANPVGIDVVIDALRGGDAAPFDPQVVDALHEGAIPVAEAPAQPGAVMYYDRDTVAVLNQQLNAVQWGGNQAQGFIYNDHPRPTTTAQNGWDGYVEPRNTYRQEVYPPPVQIETRLSPADVEKIARETRSNEIARETAI